MKKNFLIAVVVILSMTACNTNQETEQMTNKQKVVELLKSIETGAAEPASYINAENYKQHNLSVADGLAGFGALLATLPPNTAKVNTIRVFEDANYVFAHTEYNFFGPKIGFDIFRFENGKIVEHWDNLMVTPTLPNPSGHTTIDGSTQIDEMSKTVENKKLIEQFVKDVLMGQNPDKLASYFDGDKYIQHNPFIADGLSGLGAALADMASNGIEMTYTKIHKVLGEANFVLVVSEGSFAGKATSYYDLFRVENGVIAEHWDVMETIAEKSTWANNNGKFNFQ